MLMRVAMKKAILNLRLRPEVREEFAVAAELRGASMSGLLHQFIVRTIREEKEAAPHAFKRERKVNEEIIRRAGGMRVAPTSKSGGIPFMGNAQNIGGKKPDGQSKKKNKRVA